MNRADIRKIVILGGGESGVGAALLAQQKGYEPFLSDSNPLKPHYEQELVASRIPYEHGQHTLETILSADLIIKSPGISPQSPVIQVIKNHNLPIISELEWGFWFTEGAKIIAISGSAGKSTTTSMIYKILKGAGLNVAICGNIGTSLSRTLASTSTPYQYLVVEVSSFQLEDVLTFHPHITVLTNISENHLDRYHYNLSEYAQTKIKGLLQHTTEEDFLVYCLDSAYLVEELSKASFKATPIGYSLNPHEKAFAFIKEQLNRRTLTVHHMAKNKKKNGLAFELPIEELKVKGKHNEYNSMASAIVGNLLSIRNEVIRESLKDFQSMEHRLESVAIVDNVHYINDSKATSALAVWYALESITTPVIWIAGGVDKGNDWGILLQLVSDKVKGIVLLSKTPENVRAIQNAFQDTVEMLKYTNSMADAVKIARQMASPGDTVLLSPGCASFDLFANFEDRGNQFKQEVLKYLR